MFALILFIYLPCWAHIHLCGFLFCTANWEEGFQHTQGLCSNMELLPSPWNNISTLTFPKIKLKFPEFGFSLAVSLTFLLQCSKAPHNFMNNSCSTLRVNSTKDPGISVTSKNDISVYTSAEQGSQTKKITNDSKAFTTQSKNTKVPKA